MANLPILSRRRDTKAIEDRAFKKAVEAIAGTFFGEEQVRKSGANAKMPGASWAQGSSWGGSQQALASRAARNLARSFGRPTEAVDQALAEQGLSWDPPFGPGRVLDPLTGVGGAARTWDYAMGENVQLVPRWNPISFNTLKAMCETYHVAQICIRHLINDVRSLDYQFIPPENVQEDATDDIKAAEDFFRYPDRRLPFRSWVAKLLQDVLRYDAGALYVRRDLEDKPFALEVVSGTTLVPLVDYFGRQPRDEPGDVTDAMREKILEIGGRWDGKTVPAYLQVIQGIPWGWHPANNILYQPWNPMPDSQYGLAPLEAVLLQANTDIRFQWHFLQYFTEGTIPAGFMEAPPDFSDIAQMREWRETWEALLKGDQSVLNQIMWVPHDSKFTPVKTEKFDVAFPKHFQGWVAAAFGVVFNDLGMTDDVNRSTGDVQVDVQFRIGTLPLVRHIEDIVNGFIRDQLKLQARLQFDVGKEVEDRLATAQAEQIYIDSGVLSPDEPRLRLGKRVSRERPTPRIINNPRSGPIPLLAVHSLGGEIDPMTYGPVKRQPLIDHPFVSAPGVAPVMGSEEYKTAQNSTANMQRNMITENSDPHSPKNARVNDMQAMTPPKPQKTPSVTESPSASLQEGGDPDAVKVAAAAMALAESLLVELEKAQTAGVTGATGVAGVDLPRNGCTDMLRRWRENARGRIKKGLAPKLFEDASPELQQLVWPVLKDARTREEVDAAFAAVGKAPAR